jgi:hypothetical protein
MGTRMQSATNDLAIRLLAKFPGISLDVARAKAQELWGSPSFRICSVWLTPAKSPAIQMNPFAAEFFSQEVLRRLEIRTVEARICSAEEARELRSTFVVKFSREELAQILRWEPDANPSGCCLVSRLVPDAASMDFVARTILKTRAEKVCDADRLYVGFRPTATEIERIKSAMSFEGAEFLHICAARAFLGTGCTPHGGNVLVTRDAQLISIDHCQVLLGNGEDLRVLFRHVVREDVDQILGRIAVLTEEDIRAGVAAIPKHEACGSTDGLADHFIKRLKLFRELCFSPQPEADPLAVGA